MRITVFQNRLFLSGATVRRFALGLCVILLLGACGGRDEATEPSDGKEAACDPFTGLAGPLPACSPETVCTRVAPELGLSRIDDSEKVPTCDSVVWSDRWTKEVLGFTRHACIRRPAGASVSSTRPLVLWFHPGGAGGADLAATESGLLEKTDTFDLTGDPSRPGFILAAIQGRYLRFPTVSPRDGLHHDFYFRDLDSPSTNPDIAGADALIDDLAGSGSVDLERIYIMGWSNGAFFGQLYAMARYETPTPGGNYVASAAVFAAANPFAGIRWDPFRQTRISEDPNCSVAIPVTGVPIFIVFRSADAAVPCNAVQSVCFSGEPGYVTDQWLSEGAQAGFNLTGLRIGGLESGSISGLDETASACTDFSSGCPTGDCTVLPPTDACLSLVNHQRWPDGKYNNFPVTGIDREVDMLNFLKDHPLL